MTEGTSRIPRRTVLTAVAVAAAVAAILGALVTQTRRPSPPLPRLGGVPGFILYDQDGRPFPSSNLEGSVWLADFFFTRCRGICPILTGRLREFQDFLGDDPGWHLVSITVDPAHDPPGALTEYAQEHGADPRRWTFLTGDPELVRNVVSFGFHLAVEEDSTSTAEPFLHSKSIVLVDSDGEIRGYYDATDEEAMRTLRRDTRRLMSERP